MGGEDRLSSRQREVRVHTVCCGWLWAYHDESNIGMQCHGGWGLL